MCRFCLASFGLAQIDVAAQTKEVMGLYEKYILPKLLARACGCKPIRKQRQKIVPLAQGIVLEIGLGDGANIPHYDAKQIQAVYGLEPAKAMRDLARKRLHDIPFKLDIIDGTAEQIPLPDASVDTVLCTYTLCTIPDRKRALKEIRRVLKPNGRFIYCEHSLAPDPHIARWQQRLDPLWGLFAGGCSISQPIMTLIDSAGFRIESSSEMYLPGTPRILGYNVWGWAGA